MRRIFILFFFVFFIIELFGQEHGINYQTVVYDNNSVSTSGQKNYLPEKELIIRFTITADGKIDYQEEHVVKTNEHGVLNVVIGQGKVTNNSPFYTRETFYDDGSSSVVTSRTFKEIDWDGNPKQLKVEVSLDKSLVNFQVIEEQELVFIPYAHHRNITAVGTLDVEGETQFNAELNVRRGHATNLSGELLVEGQSNLNGKLTVNAPTTINDIAKIKSDNTGFWISESTSPFIIETKNQGIYIDVPKEVSGDINYMTFEDGEGVQGGITGQSFEETYTDPEYIFTSVMYVVNIASKIATIIVGIIEPSPSDIAIESVNLGMLVADAVAFQIFYFINSGISYSSGAGDYAEWLPKLDINEEIHFGEIVAVKGGKITKNLDNAEQIMVVSLAPAVLGNIPSTTEEEAVGEKVAFMGQVPVWVKGKVNKGDFIVADTLNNGIAVAISPENINVDVLNRIVGRAWESNLGEHTKLVNTVVGLQNNDIYYLLKKDAQKIADLENYIEGKTQELEISEQILSKYISNKGEVIDANTNKTNRKFKNKKLKD